MMHPVKWLKRKWQEYLDYDLDWEREYQGELEPVPVPVNPRAHRRWGQPDHDFDYLFDETRPMRRVMPDGTIVDHTMSTVTFRRPEPMHRETETMPQTEWTRRVLHEMDVEFRSRLLAPVIDWEDPVYSRRHREAISAATLIERQKFQSMETPDWNDDWNEYLKSEVATSIVKRALHASDRGAPDTALMQRINA